MILLETWRDTAIRDGIGRKGSMSQIAIETGLTFREVALRATRLKLLSAREAARLAPLPRRRGIALARSRARN